MPLHFEAVRIVVALVGTAAAAWQDHQTSFIDDRVVLPLIGLGLLLNFATLDAAFVWQSLLVPLLIAVVGYALYKAGQLGAGDVLLFLGIALLLPSYPPALGSWLATLYGANSVLSQTIAFVSRPGGAVAVPFFVSVFVASGILGLLGSALQFARALLLPAAGTKRRKLRPNWAFFAFSVLALALVSYAFSKTSAGAGAFVLLLVIGIPAVFLTTFREQILADAIIRRVPFKDVLDEDVIAVETLPKAFVKKHKIGRVATPDQLKILKRLSQNGTLTRIPVYQNLPRFAAYILAGLIVTLLTGDVMLFLLSL